MDKFLVKTIEESDLDNFTSLWNQGYEVLTSSQFKMTNEKAKDGFKSKLFDYIGLYKNKLLIGFILLVKDENKIWIKHLLVDKYERTKGLGKVLIEESIGNRNEEIFAEVLEENEIALKFFLSNKFQIIKNDKENHQYVLKLKK